MDHLQNNLLSLNNDIPHAIMKHFCSTANSSEQINENVDILFSYYIHQNKLTQFIDYLIEREIHECFRTPSSIFRRNSIYMRILKIFLDYEMKDIVTEIINVVKNEMKQIKIKLQLGNTQNVEIEHSVNKIADIISKMLEYLFNISTFSDGFSYFIQKASVLLEQKTPTIAKSAIKNLLFLRTINSELVKQQSKNAQESESYKALSVALQWFVGDSFTFDQKLPPEQNWKIHLGTKLGKLRIRSDNWINFFSDMQPPTKFSLSWVNKESHVKFIPKIQNEWIQIMEHLSPDSKILFRMIFEKENNEYDIYSTISKQFQPYEDELLKEKTNQMIHMTELSMQVNELRNERMFLIKSLVEKDPSYSYLLDDQ